MGKDLHVVLIEDSAADVKKAYRVLELLNVKTPTVFTLIPAALMYLEDVVDGKRTCPDLILLDLVLGADSGFEVLRYFKMHPALARCHVVVWTAMGDVQQELCRHFGVLHVVSKDDGDGALLQVMKKLTSGRSPSAQGPIFNAPGFPNSIPTAD